jgi:hypothetical protein
LAGNLKGYRVPLPEITPPQPIDALLVLGRGIEPDGTLSQTGFERAEVAVDIARRLIPRVVVFSGGHSWVQALEGITPPSEGGAMLAHASRFIDDDLRSRTRFLAEETSTSTVANMVNSRPQLGLSESGARLGILSDSLHFRFGRAQRLARLVFPNTVITPLQIDREETPGSVRDEKLTALMTRVAMAGVSAGNEQAIMRRQRALERGNAVFRRAMSHLAGERPGYSAAN